MAAFLSLMAFNNFRRCPSGIFMDTKSASLTSINESKSNFSLTNGSINSSKPTAARKKYNGVLSSSSSSSSSTSEFGKQKKIQVGCNHRQSSRKCLCYNRLPDSESSWFHLSSRWRRLWFNRVAPSTSVSPFGCAALPVTVFPVLSPSAVIEFLNKEKQVVLD